ncbi:MAG: RluA family pseudouridine synthase [Pyrinomonadaceae bacterium]|nr:RluA family pseudouridine synthase [Pyrinomonadaceae bacterium]
MFRLVNTIYHFEVGEPEAKQRLDTFIFDRIGALSRLYLTRKINAGACFVNAAIKLAGYKLKNGDVVEITLDADAPTSMMPEEMPLEIIFEDDEILIVNKAAGILVHPTSSVKSGTLLNALAFHLNPKPESQSPKCKTVRAGLVHRLDKETSGLLVIAKTSRSHRILSNHFQRKLIKKLYFAVVETVVAQDFGTINAPIARVDDSIPHWRIVENGKAATTNFKVIERRETSTLLELEPVTGRTNQLRIHCQSRGFPIVGDEIYGAKPFKRLCLHAAKLSFFHPNGGWREFETGLPEDFQS